MDQPLPEVCVELLEERQSAPCRLPREDSGVSLGLDNSDQGKTKAGCGGSTEKGKERLGFLEISSKSRAPVLRAVLW